MHTFFVMIKLDPMATVPDTARARPTYLSSTMKSGAGGEGERSGEGGCGGRGNCDGITVQAAATDAHVSDVQAQIRKTIIYFQQTRIVI